VDFLMLIAVSIGSLAAGVLSAYGVLRVAFTAMRPQRKKVVKAEANEEPILVTPQ
jgi:hypothetical protein